MPGVNRIGPRARGNTQPRRVSIRVNYYVRAGVREREYLPIVGRKQEFAFARIPMEYVCASGGATMIVSDAGTRIGEAASLRYANVAATCRDLSISSVTV